MRFLACSLAIALSSVSVSPSMAQCRCGGCAAPADAAVPQNQVFWDARSGRHLYFASQPKTWYYWHPEQRQWIAVAPTSQGPVPAAPAAPAAQTPPSLAIAPANSDLSPLSPGRQLAAAPGSAPAQPPYGGQRTCPVMDEELGAHGPAIPVAVRGQTIFVCCKGCVRQVQANQDRYLAKVLEERRRFGAATN